MLTIQPKVLNNYRPAFKASENFDNEEEITLNDLTEDKYESMRDELEDQRDEFEELADDKELNLPKPINKVLKGGAVVTTGLLGGMATGWGTKKSLAGLNKLGKTKAMQSVKKQIIDCKVDTVKTAKSLKTKFLESNLYTKISNAITNGWRKFGETKIGKPIAKFLTSVGSGIKNIYKKIASGIKHVWDKIRGVKKETWEKATVNTVGVSGGVASGVTALKEKDGDKD